MEKCFERLVIVALNLAKCNLPFRESSEKFLKDNKSNFLSIIQFVAKYDTVLDKLLQLPKGSPKYLSPLIQNQLISILAEEVLRDINSEIQSGPFFAIVLDTTQDVSKKDQLSEVFRYVKIDDHDDRTPSELKVFEDWITQTDNEFHSAEGA